jgi:hypothetical protein
VKRMVVGWAHLDDTAGRYPGRHAMVRNVEIVVFDVVFFL